jgi:carboxyl-terminal processing protease
MKIHSLKFLMLLSTFLVSASHPVSAQSFSTSNKLDQALEIIKYAYVDTINEKKVTDDALRTMMKDLDPHSVYIPLEEMREMNEPLVGKFEGIGIQFNIHDDTIMVTQTIVGGPSEKLGIRAGDRIVKIDGQNVASVKITNNDVLKKLRGAKGTKVTVGILRRGVSNLMDFTITRDQIPLFSVDAAYQVAPGIGYIKIARFADSTVEEFKKALEKLKALGITSLILDLSDNGGGYLNRAVELADEFLPEGKKIVYTRGRVTTPEDYY